MPGPFAEDKPMKIKITEDGYLEIERAGTFESQLCPLSAAGQDVEMNQCGSWCPHFGEPVTNPQLSPQENTSLDLCHGTVLVGAIVDERRKE